MSQQPVTQPSSARTLAEMVDTLRTLKFLVRAARRRAMRAAREGQRSIAMRFSAHARLLARAAAALQIEIRRALVPASVTA